MTDKTPARPERPPNPTRFILATSCPNPFETVAWMDMDKSGQYVDIANYYALESYASTIEAERDALRKQLEQAREALDKIGLEASISRLDPPMTETDYEEKLSAIAEAALAHKGEA